MNETSGFSAEAVNGSTVCIMIRILDDECFEKTEYFNFHVYPLEPNVHVYEHEYVPVHIYDDDGKSGRILTI